MQSGDSTEVGLVGGVLEELDIDFVVCADDPLDGFFPDGAVGGCVRGYEEGVEGAAHECEVEDVRDSVSLGGYFEKDVEEEFGGKEVEPCRDSASVGCHRFGNGWFAVPVPEMWGWRGPAVRDAASVLRDAIYANPYNASALNLKRDTLSPSQRL